MPNNKAMQNTSTTVYASWLSSIADAEPEDLAPLMSLSCGLVLSQEMRDCCKEMRLIDTNLGIPLQANRLVAKRQHTRTSSLH